MQRFTLTARTLTRFRIGGNLTVRQTLQRLALYRGIGAAQPNWLYRFGQAQAAPPDTGAQYVVGKLHLIEAHRISNGDDVTIALIDSRVDVAHPDLAGVVAAQYDAIGGTGAPHPHGTAMAGAIAAHAKLMGVAPKVRLLAIRAFAGEGDSAQGTTFSILKELDWAASRDARIVNMSFAGPADAMMHDMIRKAHARSIGATAVAGITCRAASARASAASTSSMRWIVARGDQIRLSGSVPQMREVRRALSSSMASE